MKSIKGYRVITRKDSEFKHCKLSIIFKESICTNEDIGFTWQYSLDRKIRGWYGYQYEIAGNDIDTLKIATKLLNKIGINQNKTPKEFINRLKELKIKEVAYHPGKAEYYTRKQWPKGNTYMATINKPNSMGNLFAVVAENEEKARRKAIKKAGERIAKNEWDIENYVTWLQEKTLKLTYQSRKFPEHEFNTPEEEENKELTA